jgi:glycosyltransferase involved in cell wall biosynthesis
MSELEQMKKPHLLLVVHLPPPIHGVTAVNQRIVDSQFLASRFQIEVLPLRFANAVEDLGRPALRKLFRAGRIATQLAWKLLAGRPDGVYFSVSPRGGAFYRDCAYIAIAKLSGAACILHLHAKSITRADDGAFRTFVYKHVFRGTHVIGLSSSLATGVEAGARVASVTYVANGIPDSGPAVTTRTVQRPRILYLSNMIREKGPLDLVDALAAVRHRGIDFEATFAGAASGDDCLAELMSRVQRYELTANVRYVGPTYGAAKEALFASHHVFVLPTYDDAFPLVLLEAMQYALPVISTSEGAIPDIVANGDTGLLLRPRDTATLANHIIRLLEDADLRREMGQRGRARYLQRFTQSTFEEMLATAWRECLRQVPPA